jgi:hypothetical protein
VLRFVSRTESRGSASAGNVSERAAVATDPPAVPPRLATSPSVCTPSAGDSISAATARASSVRPAAANAPANQIRPRSSRVGSSKPASASRMRSLASAATRALPSVAAAVPVAPLCQLPSMVIHSLAFSTSARPSQRGPASVRAADTARSSMCTASGCRPLASSARDVGERVDLGVEIRRHRGRVLGRSELACRGERGRGRTSCADDRVPVLGASARVLECRGEDVCVPRRDRARLRQRLGRGRQNARPPVRCRERVRDAQRVSDQSAPDEHPGRARGQVLAGVEIGGRLQHGHHVLDPAVLDRAVLDRTVMAGDEGGHACGHIAVEARGLRVEAGGDGGGELARGRRVACVEQLLAHRREHPRRVRPDVVGNGGGHQVAATGDGQAPGDRHEPADGHGRCSTPS